MMQITHKTLRRLFGPIVLCLAASFPASANEDLPKDNLEVTFFSAFNTCPGLVAQERVPADFDLSSRGLKPAENGMGQWEGRFNDGVVFVDFDAEARTCATSLSHPAYKRFGDFVIGMLSDDGFIMLVDKRAEKVPGAVLTKISPDQTRRVQYTIVQNPNGPLLTISYLEKANF